MADVKRYYWLRLHDDFFRAYRIKKLRKMAAVAADKDGVGTRQTVKVG